MTKRPIMIKSQLLILLSAAHWLPSDARMHNFWSWKNFHTINMHIYLLWPSELKNDRTLRYLSTHLNHQMRLIIFELLSNSNLNYRSVEIYFAYTEIFRLLVNCFDILHIFLSFKTNFTCTRCFVAPYTIFTYISTVLCLFPDLFWW